MAGKQSLLLDATGGRRILNNSMKGLGPLREEMVLSFRLMILRRSRQSPAREDVAKGLTAGMVAFDRGRIASYRPEIRRVRGGRYGLAQGRLARGRIAFEPRADRGLLTVAPGRRQDPGRPRPRGPQFVGPARNPEQAITPTFAPGASRRSTRSRSPRRIASRASASAPDLSSAAMWSGPTDGLLPRPANPRDLDRLGHRRVGRGGGGAATARRPAGRSRRRNCP
ncbi:MAG: hypothetical protein WKF75_20235 [Singulisphaera sp.]